MLDPMVEFDLIIIGAGPAGCTLALNLAGTGLRIALLDKSTFPREKICGDALSGHVMSVLRRMPGNIWEEFLKLQPKTESCGIRFVAPNGKFMDIPFAAGDNGSSSKAGFLCRRIVFDNFLADKVKASGSIDFREDFTIDEVTDKGEFIELTGPKGTLTARMVAGADGNQSVIASKLARRKPDKKNYSLGIRGYYEGVTDLHPQNFIELFFFRDILPGYLWIFPMENGLANVGLGVLHNKVVGDKIVLAQLLQKMITTNPALAKRFKNAKLTGRLEAHGLPMGPDPRPISGNRYILLGDAASLVDPFTGEGIGNAMMSGEVAARVLQKAFEANDLSAAFLSGYDRLIHEKSDKDLKVNLIMQRLTRIPALINFTIGSVSKSASLQSFMTRMYTDPKARAKLGNPLFYLGLLFKR